MPEHFFIRMGEAPDLASVVALNEDGHRTAGPETVPLAAAAGRAEGRQITVLLPAGDVVSCAAAVPPASPGRLRQMLPYSLEDDFAGDVDELHFAPGERNEAGALAVSVIGRDRIAFWQEALRAAGLEARRICSEADGVPDTPGVVTLMLDEGGILGRRPGGAPFWFEELGLAEVWELLTRESEDSGDLDRVVLFVDAGTLEKRRAEIDAWRQGIAEVNVRELADGVLPKLASTLVFAPGPNLLQGDYARRSSIGTLARPWRTAAGFALALIGFSVIGTGAEVFKLSREEARLTEQAASICAESYGSNQLSLCLAEMARRLAESGQAGPVQGGGFLPALAAVAAAIDEAMTVASISYTSGALTLDLNTPDLRYYEAFGDRLTRDGEFALAVQNTTSERDDSVTVRVRITEAER